jgi:hypothetical protein
VNRDRGKGRLYKQRDRAGNLMPTWWMAVYVNGRMQRISTGTTDEKKATKILDMKVAEKLTDTFVDPKKKKTTTDELYKLSLDHYKLKKRKSTAGFMARWKNRLQPVFGGRRASHVTTADVNKYILQRQKENASAPTINRELAGLKKMFNFAAKRGQGYPPGRCAVH